MGTIGQMIAGPGRLALAYAERLATGINPREFGRFARPGGAVVQSNHPAFVYGHLALYPARVLQHLSQPTGVAAFPPEWEVLFKNGVECQDDPDCTRYPPMQTLTRFAVDSHNAALQAVEAADDSLLCAPNPSEGRMRELFPTLGGMIAFYVGGHPQIHLGQVSAWRRMMGLPPV